MKQKTFNILFFLKKARTLKNGEATICMRITVNRRPCEILIGHSASVEQWDQAKGKVRGKGKTEDSTKNIKSDKKYNDFYPNLSLSQEIGEIQMSLDMNRRTRRPSFSELNDNNVYINRFLTQKGNPYLGKEDIYEVNYRMGYKILNFSLGYTYIKNPINFNVQGSEKTSLESILTFTNYPKFQKLSALASVNYKIGFWQAQLTVGLIQPFFTANYNGQKIKHNQTDVFLKFYNDIVFPRNYIFSVNYNYQSDYDDYITRWGSYQRLDIGLRKLFFDKSLTINLQARDIFNWAEKKTDMSIDNYNLKMNKRQETRYVTLTIRYLFNNYQKKYRGKNASSDDIDRL